jgi:DNA-directed RNA polymerase subunit M/transcription elongation factor TFIIS
MEINCPHCNEDVLISDDEVSTIFECPFCLQQIQLEQEEETLPPKLEPEEEKVPQVDESNQFKTPLNPLLCLCPACGKSVSKKADICVNCGHPIYNGLLGKAGASRIINIIFLAFLALMLFGCLFSPALMSLGGLF